MPLLTDPMDIEIGADNDIVIENGDLVWVRGLDAVVQACRIAMQMFREEWFLNLDVGLPYWQSILGQKPAIAQEALTIYVRSELMLVEGVVDVTKLQVTYDRATRAMSVTWQVDTEFGETPPDTIDLRVTTGGV